MKKYSCLIFFSVMWLSFAQAQSAQSPLKVGELSSPLLEQLILDKVNEHRKEKKLQSLQTEEPLVKAAANHSSYQGGIKKLTHTQENNIQMKTPSLRVAYYQGKFNLVGENVAFVSLNAASTYETVAEDLFQGWMHSPPHYKNIITADYRNSGIRFRFGKDPKTNQPILYATHVFAGPKSRYFSKVKVPEDAYGLLPRNGNCDYYEHIHVVSEALANFIIIKEDSIFLKYHDLEQIKNYILPSDKDGLAIDIVEREQFPCDGPNLTDVVGAYQGVLLAPKFKEELLANNRMKDRRQFLAFLGKLPEGLVDHYQLNVINIFNKSACFHSNYVEIPSSDIALVEILPVWHSTSKIKKYKTKEVVNQVQYERGKSTLSVVEKQKISDLIKTYKGKIQRIHIFATSSVEGTSSKNNQLGIDRAEHIQDLFVEAGFKTSIINYHSLERWDLFREQISGTPFAFLLQLDDKAVQKRLNEDKDLAEKVEYLLEQQRMTQVTLKITDEATPDVIPSDEAGLLAKFEALVAAKKVEEALQVQSKMIYAFVNDKLSKETLLATELPMEKAYLPLLSNQITAKLFFGEFIPHSILMPNWGDPFLSVTPEFTEKLMQLSAMAENDLPMQFNMSVFAIKYMRYTYTSFVDVTELYQSILKFKDASIYGKIAAWNTDEIDRLKLNFHLAAVDYFYENFEYDKRENSLKYVLKNYKKENLAVDEYLYLAKYFNRNFRFNWAQELLEASLEQHPNHEDTYFTYMQVLSLLQDKDAYTETFQQALEKALKMNPKRLCRWINANYQFLNNEELKVLFCENCE